MTRKKKFKKSYWLPMVIALYAIGISLYFGPELIKEGLAVKFWISVGVEAAIIIALTFFLRRKEKLAKHWDKGKG